jgi:hypothetical protein
MFYDALAHLQDATAAEERGDRGAIERHVRATLFTAFASLEAQINQVAWSYASTYRDELDDIELDILEEKETFIDDRGNVVRRTRFYPFDTRFSFIVRFLTGESFERSGVTWQALKTARELRDMWTHPKPPFDTWSISIADGQKAVRAVAGTLTEISRMMGAEPPLWLSRATLPQVK